VSLGVTDVVIKNFSVRKLDNTLGELELAKKKFASPEFIPTNEFWLASFEIEGEGLKREAGIRRGRRVDVAEDMDMIDVQIRVAEEEFAADKFIPESNVAEIARAVSEEFIKGEYWLK
jgi:hypothetical protein